MEDQLQIDGYGLHFDKNLKKSRIALFVNKSCGYNIEVYNSVDLIKAENNTRVVYGLYRPFKLRSKLNHLAVFNELLEKIIPVKGKDLIVLGDFNVDVARFSDASYNFHELSNLLMCKMNTLNLTQLVNKPTWRRIIKGTLKESTLDHVYMSLRSDKVIPICDLWDTNFSDHLMLRLTLPNPSLRANTKKKLLQRSWKHYSKLEFQNSLNQSLKDYSLMNVNDHADSLEAPEKLMSPNETQLSWSNKLKNLIRKKSKVFKRAKSSKSKHLFAESRAIERAIRKETKSELRKEATRKLKNFPNQKNFWETVNKITKSKKQDQISNLLHNAKVYITNEEKAEVLAEVFDEKIRLIRNSCVINKEAYQGEKVMNCDSEPFPFAISNLSKCISQFKPKKSFGYDRIPMKAFIDAWPILQYTFADLFRKIYHRTEIPHKWKIGRILPLHKKGTQSNPTNYRPITNLCCAAKLFEKCILEVLRTIEIDAKCDITHADQHGFKKDKSTTTAALSLKRKIIQGLENGKFVGVASLDLSSAFDVVNRELLIKRLNVLGLPTGIVVLISEWLNNRSSYVEVNDACSTQTNTPCGTVQGSIMGPFLFALYLSPLFAIIKILMAYADDSYIIVTGNSIDEVKDLLEKELQKAYNWLTSNGLKVNEEKTEVVFFGRKNNKTTPVVINGKEVTPKSSMRVLGICFDEKLNWRQHILEVSNKIKRNIYGLSRLRGYLSAEDTKIVAKTCVLPKLYYGSQIFLTPSLNGDSRRQLKSAERAVINAVEGGQDWTLVSTTDQQELSGLPNIKQRIDYTTAMLLHDSMRDNVAWMEIEKNMVIKKRAKELYFVSSNKKKIGNQLIENSLKTLKNKIPQSFKLMSRDFYKRMCKGLFL
jgi:hypothetical protein